MNDEMVDYQIPEAGNFTFSAINPDDLQETAYTIAHVVLDNSGSLAGQEDLLTELLKTITNALKKSSRSENILLRVITFNNNITEVHGFKPVSQINTDDYENITTNGMTALIDAMFSAITSTYEYAKQLEEDGFETNAAIYVITDGQENVSLKEASEVANKIKQIQKGEEIESIVTALFGMVNGDPTSDTSLKNLQKEVSFTEYISAGDVTMKNVGKIGGVVSQSITSTSKSLGTGGPSSTLPSKAF